ncbi:hypothetical protein C7974DRAFT_411176 [Boeremia exigua]|uniref:uncharacterized protein n=1 Tax=Boeremia exigua TaxID=749465 RepID=UPI001E8E9851|nr:uncharacterized protein C7974DRAFT_411176 [Boeremia exigua]KAH6637708.1 hypothetical protein C7974DRAFT_411176 [Boeremia exigua]
MSSKPYTGPDVPTMLQTKTLAENVIKYHDHPTSDSILDDHELGLLKRFVEDPTRRAEILREEGVDPEAAWESRQTGLVAYVVWAHGREERDGGVLKEEDFELLRGWFAGGKVV